MARHAPHITHHLAELRNAERLDNIERAAAARKGLAAAGFDEADEGDDWIDLQVVEAEEESAEQESASSESAELDAARSVAPLGRHGSSDRMSTTTATPPVEKG